MGDSKDVAEKAIRARKRQVWRMILTARRREILDRIMQVEGCNRAEAFDVLCHIHTWGFTSHVRNDVRGRVQAIAAQAELGIQRCLGDSVMASRLKEIRKSALEIPTLLGDGPDGARVGNIYVIPARQGGA